jgi:hypothetical protein
MSTRWPELFRGVRKSASQESISIASEEGSAQGLGRLDIGLKEGDPPESGQW